MRIAEILIVGGKEEDFALLNTALTGAELAGHVQWAKGRDEAIALLQREGKYADRQAFPLPGLVFVDLRESPAEGFQVLWWLRRLPDMARVPAIVITRSSLSGDVSWAYATGASSFVVGGHSAAELTRAVKAAVEYWSSGLGTAITPGRATA